MLTLIQKLAHLCLAPLIALFDFPVVPAELTTLVNKLFEYIQAGTGILFLSTLSLRRATAKVHKTVGHFCAYGTNFMGIASSC